MEKRSFPEDEKPDKPMTIDAAPGADLKLLLSKNRRQKKISTGKWNPSSVASKPLDAEYLMEHLRKSLSAQASLQLVSQEPTSHYTSMYFNYPLKKNKYFIKF